MRVRVPFRFFDCWCCASDPSNIRFAILPTKQTTNKQALLNGFLKRRKRDSAFVMLALVLVVCAWLVWPILFSLRVDGSTSMSWATVWIPLWIADGIGELSFVKG